MKAMRPAKRRGHATALSCGVLGFITVAVACREPTQITVRITTGEKCSSLSPVQTVVGPTLTVTQQRFADRFTTAATSACDASGLIGTLVLTPGGDGGTILVAAGISVGGLPAPDAATCADPEVAKRCIIARRGFAFLDHTSLSLPIHLDPLCIGKPCDPASTCFKGGCVDANVACSGSECGLPQEIGQGGGGAGEAGSSDGAYDADTDGGGFDDASFDSGDGSIIGEAGPDAEGGTSPNSPSCSIGGGAAVCSAPTNGESTAGPCSDRSIVGPYCCQCKCPSGAIASCASAALNGACSTICPAVSGGMQ